jgi:hypothetical protein
MAAAVSHGFTGVGRWLRKEFVAAWPVFLFFLVGFLILITLIKLALEQVSVETTVLSNAIVGALLAAKAALVLDDTPLARALENYRRVVAVAVKTLFYGLASLLLLAVERLLEALHKTHNLDTAFVYAWEHVTRYRALAWALGISVVFALYFVFVEINARMGEGALWRLFFESPMTANGSGRPSSVSAGKRRS